MRCFKVIVVLLISSVVKCEPVSEQELQDFKQFLEKTSALDHTLKDGFDHGDDEEEAVSDHAWEESGKFEGDLILSDRQRHLIVEDVAEGLSRNGLNDITKRWPNNEVIYYIQKEHFSGSQVQAIQDGIDDIGQSSCITFRPYKKGDRDAVVIQGSRRGCYSQVGYQGGYQVLNLSRRHAVGRGCFRHGTVVHEMLHTLGFYHMQSSADRDDFINVAWENIIQGAKHNFRKYNSFAVTDFGVGYDYDSVLHYSKRAFSSNGKATLVPKQDGVDIGQRIGMSDKDKDKLNKMYCDSNNNDQSDDSISKHKKKQKPKNKPFQGHGIGYHQGKAVVIKVPTADTKVLQDFSYPIYDYYTKSINSDYIPQYELDSFYKDDKTFVDSNNDVKIQKGNPTINNLEKKYVAADKQADDKDTNIENNKDSNADKLIVKNNTKIDAKTSTNSKLDHDLDDAFDRLRKIIKTHVYPKYSADSIENHDKIELTTSTNKLRNDSKKYADSHMNTDEDSSSVEDFRGFGENLQKRLSSILKETDEEHEKISMYSRPTIDHGEKLFQNDKDYKSFPSYNKDEEKDNTYDRHLSSPYKYPSNFNPTKWFHE